MISIEPDKLPENIVSMAHDLVKHEGAYPSENSEYGYFNGSKRPDVIGRHVLTLYEGSHGGDGGYESYASGLSLHYFSDKKLRKVTFKDVIEPGGPLLMLPTWNFERPDVAKYLSHKRREEIRERIASTATYRIVRMTKLLQDDTKV